MSEKDTQESKETSQQSSEVDTGVETKEHESSEHAEPDYEALYQKEIEKNESLKEALHKKRQLRNKEEKSEENESDDEKPLTMKNLREVLNQEIVPIVSASKEDQLLASMVPDQSKRKLVKYYLENKIVRTGTSDEAIQTDIEFALAGVDRKKTLKVNEELRRAADNKPQSHSSAGGSSEKDIEKQKITPELKASLEARAKRIGVDPKKFVERYIENRGKTPVLG